MGLTVAPPSQLDYPFAAPEYGALTQVAPGVCWLRMPLPFSLEHINLWLLADGAGWTVVDCGYATSRARELWERVLGDVCGDRAVTRIIVTHFHPDHIGLAAWLAERCGVVPWMTEPEYALARAARQRTGGTTLGDLRALFLRHGLAPERINAVSSPEEHYRSGVPKLPRAFRPVSDGDTLEIGGSVWRVIVGHGHSPAHACLYCASIGVLISGDMVLPRISPNVSVWPMEPDGNPLGQYLGSLERLATLPAATLVLPSHGLPFRGLQQRVAELRAHHRARLERALDVCREPHTAAQLLTELFGRDFQDYQLLFAMGEAIAHLNHLMHDGELERSADGGGILHFAQRSLTARRGAQ